MLVSFRKIKNMSRYSNFSKACFDHFPLRYFFFDIFFSTIVIFDYSTVLWPTFHSILIDIFYFFHLVKRKIEFHSILIEMFFFSSSKEKDRISFDFNSKVLFLSSSNEKDSVLFDFNSNVLFFHLVKIKRYFCRWHTHPHSHPQDILKKNR
jgi:hypothetical protein